MIMRNLIAILSSVAIVLSSAPLQAKLTFKDFPETREISDYHEVIQRLPFRRATEIVKEMTQSGNCEAAYWFSHHLERNKKVDPQGNDARYWLYQSAKCGDVAAKIEYGHPDYSTSTTVPCGKNVLHVKTDCFSIDKEQGLPWCHTQKFSFLNNKKKLLKAYTANYKHNPDNPPVAYSVYCAPQSGGYFIITFFNFGGSCCERIEIFDSNGKYLGYTSHQMEMFFKGIQEKRLSRKNAKIIFDDASIHSRFQIELYPEFK